MEEPVSPTDAQYRHIVEALPLIAWIADPRGEVTYFNEAWATFTGMSREEAVGSGYQAVLHVDDLPAAWERWARSLETGEPFENLHRFRRFDGEYRWQLARAVPIRRADGGVVQWIGTCTDIDDRRRSEDSAKYLAQASSAFANSSGPAELFARIAELAVPEFADWAAVDLVEADGSIRRVALAHGVAEQLAQARALEVRFPPPDGPVRAAIDTGEPVWVPLITPEQIEATAQHPDHLAWLRTVGPRSFLCVPIEVAGKRMAAVTFVFSGSGRRYRQADVDTAQDLARRASVALDNARLYAELQATDRQKSEFIAVLAHELRNPLAPLRSGIEVLMSGARDPAETLRQMERQLGHLERLVDDLLDLDRISRGVLRVHRAPVALAEVLLAAIDTSEPHVRAKGHVLTRPTLDGEVWVHGDAVRLSQVFSNLLNNAARYTPRGGQVAVEVQADAAEVEIRVRDTGIGLRDEDLARVFDLFVRVADDVPSNGIGIGLALARRLVEDHGGTITARSPGLGLGSTFVVRLPRAPSGSAAAVAPAPRAGPSLRVLLADDNREAADLLASSLASLGHELFVAYDGAEAWRRLAEVQPDVALLDIGMPEMDGRALARRIRGEPWGENMLLVALTGWGEVSDREASMLAGFNRHITKPVKRAALQELLSSWVERRQ